MCLNFRTLFCFFFIPKKIHRAGCFYLSLLTLYCIRQSFFFPLSCTAEAPAAGTLVRVEPQGQAYNRFVLRGGTTTVCCMSSH